MTDDIEKIVQEAECVAAADEYFKARTWIMDTNDNRRIFEAGFDRAYALLSKLRAPVADERAAIQHHVDLVKAYGDQLYCKASASNPTDKNSWSKSAEAVLSNVAESYRAALASAPVAGEAQRAVAYEMYNTKTGHAIVDYSRHTYVGHLSEEAGYEARPLVYAAPQASEAVRDADPVIGHITVKGKGRSSVDLDASHADLPEGEYVIRAALSAQPGAQKYWLCCGSRDPNHPNRRAPDCFNAAKAKWGTADQHSAAQKNGGSDA